jgi:ATP-binding cassette subfamily F protein 3
VLHFEGGTAFAYTGSYASFIAQREERRLTQLRQFDQQSKKIASEEQYIARNLAGQNTRQAKGRRKLLARMPRLSAPIGADGVMALRLQSGARSGDRVIEAEHVTVGVMTSDGPRELIQDFSVVLERGEVIALLGPNGAGKSTLIKTLLEEHPVFAGRVKKGPSTTVAYYRQDLAHLPLESAIYDVVADLRPLWERRQVQGHLGKFGFSGDEVQRTVGTLSGGERARVALALLTLEQSNLLILDEPTNHLDVESIEAMEDAIEDYEGSALIVSHDRAVLRGVATQVWELRDQQLLVFPGSFVEWEEARADSKAKAEHEARGVAARESEKNAKVRAQANAQANAAQRASRETQGTKPHAKHDAKHNAKQDAKSGKGNSATSGDQRKLARQAEKELADAELRVSVLEGRIAELTRTLEDTTLYDTPAGTQRAQALGRELDDAKDALDGAVHDWSTAAERVQTAGKSR